MFSWGELFSTFMARKIMGAKPSCRSPGWGGCPFFYALHIPNGVLFPPPFPAPSRQIFRQSGQKRAKVNDFLVVLGVFSGFSETENGKNKDLFYFRGLQALPWWLSIGGGGRAHWVQVGRASRVSDSLLVCSAPFSLPFVLSVAFAFLQYPRNMPLFAF